MPTRYSSFYRPKRPADNYAHRGMAFESALSDMHRLYTSMGRGWIVKQYIPVTLIDYQKGLARVTGRGTVDYLGCIDGRFVAFDAKDCEAVRIKLDRLQPHQLLDMMDVERVGGKAFILARFERQRCYCIPALAWAAAIEAQHHEVKGDFDGWTPKGAASIAEKELPTKWAVDGYDWLKTISRVKEK